ncbi:hypothetical protein Pyn_07961 [Prunus yedoensis var. nudiflora]|uniref:STAS domain-containing protein n=1 Tax=Prunus yedoensis var. nudiflora TaxID=2094558 RepID=A0A314YT00_PRUYE|nr:hypothetical protein Pyn_07961 [Prunus yedoensis var. nudiflora]
MGVNSNRVEDLPYHETTIRIPTEAMPPLEIHRVCLPPNRPPCKNSSTGLFFFPIFQWGPEYNVKLLKSDVISGLTIASLAIPQGISYAKLASLPPIVGLYSSFVPPLIYSVLGSSRHLAVGPVSIASLVMGSMLSFSGSSKVRVYNRFSLKGNLIGFMAGASVIVILQQLKGLLGIVHFTTKMQFFSVMSSIINHRGEWSWQTIVMGVIFLVFLFTTRHISKTKPKLFWVAAAAPLTSVIISTVLVFFLSSKNPHISVIGHLPKGLNPPSSNMLYFNGPFLALAIKTGIITGILSLTEGVAVGRTFAALKNYQVDGNKEMMAIGLMNICGSFSSCYVTTGSFSRSAVNYNAGAKTVVSNIIMASAVLVTLLFLMPLFYYTPNVILAAIIITAVSGLIDYQAAYRLWKVDKLDFLACMCSFFGVLFISVPLVGVSIFKILLHVTRPNTMVLGNIPRTQTFQNVNRYREALRIPSFLILAVEAPIYFANTTYLQERILRWVREEEERIKESNESTLKCIILDMTAVTAIDTSGTDMMFELRKMLDKRSLQLVLANPVGTVMEKLQQSKTLESFGLNGVYLTVGEAVADISSAWKAQP